jgi:hypothetical protein
MPSYGVSFSAKESFITAKLTEADQRAFSHQVLEVLRQNSAKLSAAGFDTSGRAGALEAKTDAAETREAEQLQAKEALLRATVASTTSTQEAYDLASATVNLIEGILGKDDPLVRLLRGLRPGMHHDPPTKPPASPNS